MVRGRVSVRLQRIQQVAARRGVALRPSAVTATPSGFIRRGRFAQIETQETRQQEALDRVINQISSLNNLNQINAVLNNAPSIIRSQVEQIRANITNQQNQTISKLQSDLTSKIKSEKKYSQRRKKAEKGSRDYERNKIKEEEYEAEISELNKLISQMRKGNLYDYSSVISRVNDVGRYERNKEEFKFDKKRAEEKANKQTLAKIKEQGLTPVVNANTGKVIGYQGGKDTGFAEYRFDDKGNPEFLKSTRFSPVYSRGKITGYVDKVAKMSIPAPLLDKHIANINKAAEKQTQEYRNFQDALSKIKLPTGFAFERDELGNIVNIDDKKRGINMDLSLLPQVTSAYLFNPTLRKLYQTTPKDIFGTIKPDPNYVKPLKTYEKFNPTKVINYTYKRRYNFYKNNFNGKLSYDEFVKAQWKAPDKNFQNTTEGKKIVKALNASLRDQIQNPDKYGTEARLTALISAASGVGLPSASLILFGSTYFGTLGLAKDVSKNPLPKDFQSVAKVVAKNFGIGAVQGLLYGLAFKGAGTLGKKLLKVSFLKGGISKATQFAIQRGLSILGVNYVSRMAGRTTFNIKNIAVGEAEVGVAELSKDLGTLVGFAIPAAISKIARNREIKIQKKIAELQKFRKGSLNAAYLKAKNAQLNDPARGEFASVGKATKLNKNALKDVAKFARKKGISKADLLDGSYYVQKFKVRSDVPKYEALLKVAKAQAKGKTVRVKSVPKYYTFKREGIVVVKVGKDGVARAFAIEFNRVGSQISNIGFKTGVGQNKLTLIKVYQKARTVKGKPVRAKLRDVFLVKNKFETKIPQNKEIVKILNQLETKKVFLNNKKLSKTELINLKSAIKKDLRVAKGVNVERVLKTLYRNKGVTSKTGFTNVVRIQRIKDVIKLIPSTKKAPVEFRIFPKGQYVELGYTKFRIPSIKKIKVLPKPVKVTPVKIKKVPKLKVVKKPVKIKPITIKEVKAPVRSMQIQVKKGVTKTKIRTVETAIKSVQTIVRPRVRAGKLVKVMPMSVTKTLVRQIGVLIPLVSTKNAQAVKNIQSNLRVSINIQSQKEITKTQLAQVKALQSASVKALQNISFVRPITPTIITPTIPTRKPTRKPTKKPVPVTKVPKPRVIKKPVKKVKDLGYTSAIIRDRKKRDLNKLPISKEKAFDIAAYNLSRSKLIRGIVSKSTKPVLLSTLKRKVASVPTGYFKKNRSRFIVRRLRTGVERYEIVRRVVVSKPKPTTTKKPVKKPVKRNVQKTKTRKPIKRSTSLNKKKLVKKKTSKKKVMKRKSSSKSVKKRSKKK